MNDSSVSRDQRPTSGVSGDLFMVSQTSAVRMPNRSAAPDQHDGAIVSPAGQSCGADSCCPTGKTFCNKAFRCAEHPVDTDCQVAEARLNDTVGVEQQGIAPQQLAMRPEEGCIRQDAEQWTVRRVHDLPPARAGTVLNRRWG